MKQIIRALQANGQVSDYKINLSAKQSYECFYVKGKLETVRCTDICDKVVTVYVDHDGFKGDSQFFVYPSTTEEELQELIETKIIEKNYIRDPMVLADFMNFQITILGEVKNNGNFPIKNNRVNLIEAIAMAGDLTKNANRKEVLVIRTVNGKRVVYPHNMRSREIYESPAFYLQQNDVVYVKPNKHQSDGNFERKTTLVSLVLTFITAFASVYYWVIK